MDVWIIIDGEKVGPTHDFEIRKQIESHKLAASTPAWHEGLDAWKPLIEIDLFTREFEITGPPPLPSTLFTDREETDALKSPATTHYLRRFSARWFDLFFYSSFWWFGMWAAKQDIEATLLNPWMMFIHYVPWFFIEAALIHRFATTPGKWLLGLHVINKDQSKLEIGPSMHRALRVMLTGVGFGWGLLAIFCQALSLFTARKIGSPAWDYAGGHQVTAQPRHPLRIATFIFLFAAAIQLQLLVISPYTTKLMIKQFPQLKETYEQIDLWHLPKRS